MFDKIFGGKSKNTDTTSPYTQDVGLAFMYSSIFAVLAVLFLVFYALGQATKGYVFLSILGITTIIAFASFAAGGIIGFLFGIPHSNPDNTIHTTAPPASAASPGSAPASSGATTPNMAPMLSTSSTVNTTGVQPQMAPSPQRLTSDFVQSTNLEQIADWLTKIFVGVGLTQIHKIITLFTTLCASLAASIETMIPKGQNPHAAPVIGGIIILFSLDGFLIVYLWTYLYLIKIQDELGKAIITTIDNKLQSIDVNNKAAIDLASTQLDLPQKAPDIPPNELVKAFGNASRNVLSVIFFKAVSVRKQNWRNPEDRFRINRTVPIFDALITLDSAFEYPENFAELGYALKDKNPPDYKNALHYLTKAIESFKENKTIDRPITYYNRAYSRIMTDENFAKEPPISSIEENKILILEDLDEAGKDDHVKHIIENDEIIKKWKSINNI